MESKKPRETLEQEFVLTHPERAIVKVKTLLEKD